MAKNYTQEEMRSIDNMLRGTLRNEDQTVVDIVYFLRKNDVKCLTEYTPQGDILGRADIYLPQRRTFIEVKQVGRADNPLEISAGGKESPFSQVKRYLRSELDFQLDQLGFDEINLPWTAIVTDGRKWHVWKFPHECASEPYKSKPSTEIIDSEADFTILINRLKNVKKSGKPPIDIDPSHLFKDEDEKLQLIHAQLRGKEMIHTKTKLSLWYDMLRGSGMAPQNDNESGKTRLFISHCFLVTLARGVIHTLQHPLETPEPRKILEEGYVAWICETDEGLNWAKSLMNKIHKYDWRRTQGDVLRPMYDHFVNKSDRKAFGEVYTPDWLAEFMVGEICDDDWCEESIVETIKFLDGQRKNLDGIGVMDPACGSGTFLYYAVRRLLSSESMRHQVASKQAEIITNLVHGIDIHPVAFEFSRATVQRALPAPPQLENFCLPR